MSKVLLECPECGEICAYVSEDKPDQIVCSLCGSFLSTETGNIVGNYLKNPPMSEVRRPEKYKETCGCQDCSTFLDGFNECHDLHTAWLEAVVPTEEDILAEIKAIKPRSFSGIITFEQVTKVIRKLLKERLIDEKNS